MNAKPLSPFALVLIALLLGACAAATNLPSPSAADHPANPDAEAAPLPAHSTTLAAIPDQPTPTASGEAGPTAHHHEMHGSSETPTSPNGGKPDSAASYVCPMHPEVTSEQPGRCPKCGMALEHKS